MKTFYFKITSKDNIITEEDERQFSHTNNSWFHEKDIVSEKVRDHRHLMGIYRGPAR